MNEIIIITIPEDLIDNFDGNKFIIEFCEGMQLAIKFVDADATTINIKTTIVRNVLFNLPIISFGFVKMLSSGILFLAKIISEPITMNIEKKEIRTKFKINDKLPLYNSFLFFTYREQSPKFNIKIEK